MVAVAQAFRQCTELRKFEFGLYAHGDGRGLSRAVDLLRPILEALPASRLTHLTFVLDLGDSSFSPDRLIPWETLDAQLSRVCVDDGWPLQVRIERYVAGDRPLQRRVDYQDQRVWCRRLPTMQHRMGVRDTVRDERRESSFTRCCFFRRLSVWGFVADYKTSLCLWTVAVGQYGAPVGIDVQRDARVVGPGLRSLFDQ